MACAKPYQEETDFVYVSNYSKYVEGAVVPTGRVLKVTHLSGAFEGIATTEYVQLGFWNGHAYVELKKALPAVIGDFVHWDGEVWLHEGQYVFAYFADVAVGEKQKLRALGSWV